MGNLERGQAVVDDHAILSGLAVPAKKNGSEYPLYNFAGFEWGEPQPLIVEHDAKPYPCRRMICKTRGNEKNRQPDRKRKDD